jgi:hypothetical protein
MRLAGAEERNDLLMPPIPGVKLHRYHSKRVTKEVLLRSDIVEPLTRQFHELVQVLLALRDP